MQSVVSKEELKILAKTKYDDISKICIDILEILTDRKHLRIRKYRIIDQIEEGNFNFGFFVNKRTGKILPMIELHNCGTKKYYFSIEKDKIIQLFDNDDLDIKTKVKMVLFSHLTVKNK